MKKKSYINSQKCRLKKKDDVEQFSKKKYISSFTRCNNFANERRHNDNNQCLFHYLFISNTIDLVKREMLANADYYFIIL